MLAAAAGVLGSRYPSVGVVCGLLLFVAMVRVPWPRLTVLLLCMAAGWSLGERSEPPPAPTQEVMRDATQATPRTGCGVRQSERLPAWFRPSVYQRMTGVVDEVSGQPDRRLRILLKDVRPEGHAESDPLPGRLNLSWDQGSQPDLPRPLPGQTVVLTTKLRPVTGFANEGVSDSAEYWAARDVWISAWTSTGLSPEQSAIDISGEPSVPAAIRERLRAAMVAELGGSAFASGNTRFARDSPAASSEVSAHRGMDQARAILPALLFGDRYSLDSETLDLFIRANLVHSLALSGQHLALAALAAAFLVWLAGRGRASLFLRVPRRTLLLGLSVPLAALYMWIGNAPLSLIRAGLMMFFGLLLWLGKRPSTLLDLLFFAALCFLLAWPQALFDLSVQLSVLSVAGIALAMPLLNRVRRLPTHNAAGRLVRNAALLLATSLAVQISTLPVILSIFGRVSPLFPLNLLWLPVLELVVMPLSALGLLLLAVFGPQPVTDALFSLAALPAQGLIDLLIYLRDHDLLIVLQGLKPTGLSMAGYAAVIVAAAMVSGSARIPAAAGRLALCAALLLPLGALEREAVAWWAACRDRVVLRVLDVGQGQALVMEWPGGRLLLDGGGSLSPRFDPGRDIVAHALTANRPPRLKIVMSSHADMDHARGLRTILDLFDVGAFVHSTLPFDSDSDDGAVLEAMRQRRNIPLHELKAGDILPLGPSLHLEIIHPPAKGRRFSSNNSSLVVRLVREENGTAHGLALLCGDAQLPALRSLLQAGRDIQADVLVVPHHGSRTSLLPEFYDAVSPQLAFISCGLYNSFGFPHPDVIRALTASGSTVYDTARQGELRVIWTKDTMTWVGVRPFRAPDKRLEAP